MLLDKPAMDELCSLRLREDDFDTVGVIGRGHFGEVSNTCTHTIYIYNPLNKGLLGLFLIERLFTSNVLQVYT